MQSGVYVLKLSNGMQYVGHSNDIQAALAKYKSTHLMPFEVDTPITAWQADLKAWERAETLARMRKYGVHRVRGFSWQSYTLPAKDTVELHGQ